MAIAELWDNGELRALTTGDLGSGAGGVSPSDPLFVELTAGDAEVSSTNRLQVEVLGIPSVARQIAATGFNASEGTLYSNFQSDANTSFPTVLSLNNGSLTNRIVIVASSSTGVRGSVASSSVIQADMNLPNYVLNTKTKAALAFGANSFGFTANSASPLTDSVGAVPSVTQIEIGRQSGGLQVMNGRIYQAAIIPKRLPDATLQKLTRV